MTAYPFLFTERYRRLSRFFGVTPERSGVEVGDGRLAARFGPWRVETALANVVAAKAAGPYAFWKTAGPARLGVTDRGLTFATNGDRGVCLTFREPVRGIEPFGLLRHPNLTLTVADVDGLVAALTGPGSAAGSS